MHKTLPVEYIICCKARRRSQKDAINLNISNAPNKVMCFYMSWMLQNYFQTSQSTKCHICVSDVKSPKRCKDEKKLFTQVKIVQIRLKMTKIAICKSSFMGTFLRWCHQTLKNKIHCSQHLYSCPQAKSPSVKNIQIHINILINL